MRDIHEVLKEHWGYDAFRPVQESVVRSVLEGRDTLALLPTGGGKSLCFQVPTMAMDRMCLVVSPLIALMKDQVEHLRAKGIRASAITSGMSYIEVENAIESAAVGKTSFLYVSPERLGSEIFQARLPRMPIGCIAVDEAHCISQWGYDFRPAYLKVAEVRAHFPDVPVIALTASATARVAEDIMEKLSFRKPNILRGSFARPELTYWIARGEDKSGRLLKIAEGMEGSGIVYVRERRSTLRTAEFLQRHGISAAAYHAGLTMEERDRVQRAWTTGTTRFVCATNAFGMGIDKPDVRVVVHLMAPPDLESYYQEAGRAGRDGKPSFAILLADDGDAERLQERVELSFPPIADVRRVYQAFADQHRIALGSGALETYVLDIRELARRTALPPTTVLNSLKALELDGTLQQNDAAREPARAMFTAPHKVIYDMRVRDNRFGPLLETLLRLYGGLFEEACIIEESRVSQQLGWSTDKVYASLNELVKLGIVMYRPRNESPTITLLVPRRDAQRLMLDKEALDGRKHRAMDRLHSILDYAFGAPKCREQRLLTYFDEPAAHPCGRCDVCRKQGASTITEGSIAITTRNTNVVLDELDGAHLQRLRWMKDEGRTIPPPAERMGIGDA